MKKLILPIAAIAALTAMAVAVSAIVTPKPEVIPAPVVSSTTATQTPEVKDDCCAKEEAVVEVAKKEDCSDCVEHKDKVEASAL